MKLALLATLPLVLTVPTTLAAQAKPRPPAATAAAPTTATITVTDPAGTPLLDVRVILTGSLDRSGSTQSNGTVRFDGLRPGSYRLRFEKEGFTTLEREIDVQAGHPAPAPSVTLTPAPATPQTPPAPAAPTAAPAAMTLPPPGKAMSVDVPAFLERNFIGNGQPQKVTEVSCSGLGRTALWQVREPWENRQHPATDAMLYVVGGEGTLRLDGRDIPLQAGTFAQVPRGLQYALARRGRQPVLIVLVTLVGEACQ